jgi:hypothetical protein
VRSCWTTDTDANPEPLKSIASEPPGYGAIMSDGDWGFTLWLGRGDGPQSYDPALHWRVFQITLIAGAALATAFYWYYVGSRPAPPIAGAVKVFYLAPVNLAELAGAAFVVFGAFHGAYWFAAEKWGLYSAFVCALGATLALAAAGMTALVSVESLLSPRATVVIASDLLHCDRLSARWPDISEMSLEGDNAALTSRDGQVSRCNLGKADQPASAVYRQIRSAWDERRR